MRDRKGNSIRKRAQPRSQGATPTRPAMARQGGAGEAGEMARAARPRVDLRGIWPTPRRPAGASCQDSTLQIVERDCMSASSGVHQCMHHHSRLLERPGVASPSGPRPAQGLAAIVNLGCPQREIGQSISLLLLLLLLEPAAARVDSPCNSAPAAQQRSAAEGRPSPPPPASNERRA